MSRQVYTQVNELIAVMDRIKSATADATSSRPVGLCGFDGFIDTFIRMESPSSMAEFGPKVAAAAGIAASYTVCHEGDKFGGNGPLFATALSEIHGGGIDLTYIGAMGNDGILPIYEEALSEKVTRLYSLADPAHSDCLEFSDGKVMLSDLRACAEITWGRLIERVGTETVDQLLQSAQFIAAVNWGKLINVGPLWRNLAARHKELGRPARELIFFMDLAEFEQRPDADRQELIELVSDITQHCRTMLSFNLKEAWQMADTFGRQFQGQKEPGQVADLSAFLREKIDADRIIIHPNDGAACASADGCVYVPGPFCQKPLISTGAGDNFGAGCIAAALLGLDDAAVILAGNCSSGHFVRSGRAPSYADMARFMDDWLNGSLPERL